MVQQTVQTNTMVMCALTDRLHACITMDQAYLWSETIDASYKGKGELPARPRVTPLPDHGDPARRLIADSLVKVFKHRT
jgi:hypothetical protein